VNANGYKALASTFGRAMQRTAMLTVFESLAIQQVDFNTFKWQRLNDESKEVQAGANILAICDGFLCVIGQRRRNNWRKLS
jgi:hypothetical protein